MNPIRGADSLMLRRCVDLNCDIGDSVEGRSLGNETAIMNLVTSVNVPCGFHALDPATIRRVVQLALESDVAIGAHPGFFDPAGSGRREMAMSLSDVEDIVLYQISALDGIVRAEGGSLCHVKPHGALYNTAAVNQDFAYAIAGAVELLDSSLVLIGLSGSCLLEAGRKKGLKVASEVFGDRAYEPTGVLRSRQFSDSLIQDSNLVVKRVVEMVRDGVVHSVTGQAVDVTADTVCVHGDTPGAQAVLRNLRMALQSTGIELASLK